MLILKTFRDPLDELELAQLVQGCLFLILEHNGCKIEAFFAFAPMFRSLRLFLFPQYCAQCDRLLNPKEPRLSLPCTLSLPYFEHWDHAENAAFKTFWGRFPLAWGSAMLRMQHEGMSRRLIHAIKYRGDVQLARYLGQHFALRLRSCKHFKIPDVIVPIPLHPKKLRTRTYNQSEEIARGMARIWGVPLGSHAVQRTIYQKSQTGRDRLARWDALQGTMRCNTPHALMGKRVLLVDDVITTGATMNALGECLASIEGIELWVCSLLLVD